MRAIFQIRALAGLLSFHTLLHLVRCSEPGVAAIVTQSGLDLVKQVAVDVGVPLLQALQIPNGAEPYSPCTSKFEWGVDPCVNYAGLKLAAVEPGDFTLSFAAGNRVRLSAPSAHLTLTGSFEANHVLPMQPGSLGCHQAVIDVRFAATATATLGPVSPHGTPTVAGLQLVVHVDRAHSSIGSFDGCTGPHEVYDWVADVASGYAWDQIDKAGPEVAAQVLQLVNQYLAEIPTTMPVPDFPLFPLSVNYALTDPISVHGTNSTAEGRIQADFRGQFFEPSHRADPAPVAWPGFARDIPCSSQICIYSTTFPLNSLSYAYFHSELGEAYNITSEVVGAQLTTDLVPHVLLPDLTDKYPGWQMFFQVSAREVANVTVTPGGLRATAPGRVDVFVQRNSTSAPVGPVMSLEASAVAGAHVSIVPYKNTGQALLPQVTNITDVTDVRILDCADPISGQCVRVPLLEKIALQTWIGTVLIRQLQPALLKKVNGNLRASPLPLPVFFGVSVSNAHFHFDGGRYGEGCVMLAANLRYSKPAGGHLHLASFLERRQSVDGAGLTRGGLERGPRRGGPSWTA